MDKIEVNPMNGLVEGSDLPPERGEICGWGWTPWDGPDAGGQLYKVYACRERDPGKTLKLWQEIYVNGELMETLPHEVDCQQWALDRGWRSIMYYSTKGGAAGPYPQ